VVQKIVRKFLKSFRRARKCFLQIEVNVARKKSVGVLRCVMVFIQAIVPKKSNTNKLYVKMFTSEIDIQNVKLEFY